MVYNPLLQQGESLAARQTGLQPQAPSTPSVGDRSRRVYLSDAKTQLAQPSSEPEATQRISLAEAKQQLSQTQADIVAEVAEQGQEFTPRDLYTELLEGKRYPEAAPGELGERYPYTAMDTAKGLGENIVSILVGDPVEPLKGLAGLRQMVASGDIDAAGEAIKQIENELGKPFEEAFGVDTRKGKEIAETIARGADTILGPPMRLYNKMVDATAGKVGETVGPNAAGATAAIAKSMPTLIAARLGMKMDVPSVEGTTLAKKGVRLLGGKDIRTKYAPTFRKKKIKERVGRLLAKNIEDRPVVARNLAEARRLEEKIPGLKLDLAGATDAPSAKRLVSIAEKSDKRTADLRLARKKANTEALDRYIQSIKGPEDPGRVRAMSEAEKVVREAEVAGLERQMLGEAKRLRTEKEPEKYGRIIRKTLAGEEKAARARASKLFEQAPDDLIAGERMYKELSDLRKPKYKGEDVKANVPREVDLFMEELALDDFRITAMELQNSRSGILRKVRQMYKATDRNRPAEQRLEEMIDAMDNAMKNDAIIEAGKSYDALNKARDYFFKNVVEKYETGAFKRIAKRDPFIEDAMILKEFFKKGKEGIGAARQFKEAAGKNKGAKKALKASIQQDLAENILDPDNLEVSRTNLRNWLKDYDYALRRYGIKREFETIKGIDNQIDEAVTRMKDFEKTVASRILNSDVGTEMAVVLNSQTPVKFAEDLMRIVGHDPRARAGAQNALIDQIRSVEPGNVKELNNLYKANEKVYKTIFRNDPMKLKALKDYQEAFRRNFPKGELPESFEAMDRVFRNFYRNPKEGSTLWLSASNILAKLGPRIGKERIRDFAAEMYLNPDLAYKMRKLGADAKPRTIRRILTQTALPRATSRATQVEEQEQ